MRLCLSLHAAAALGLVALAPPALADTLRGEARVVHVTLFPEGAAITRQVTVQAPAGAHRIVIPGLPQDTDPASLRLTATGASIGAASMQTGRALPADLAEPPAVTEARAALQAAEAALRGHDTEVRGILLRAEAAKETVAFLRDLAKGEGAATTDIATLAADVEARILAAKQTALAAETEAEAKAPARKPLVERVEVARAALAAIAPPDAEQSALVVEVEATGAGPTVIEAVVQDPRASWQPVYDARLDSAAGSLTLDRGVLVRQDTGEDWQGVALTLSTARPSGQAMPSELDPEIVSTEPDYDGDRGRKVFAPSPSAEVARGADTLEAEPASPSPITADARMQGLTLVFDYPRPADIRSGVDGLRLALDSATLTPDIRAEAVPLYDSRATLVAEAKNGDDLLLPGQANLYADGALVGSAAVETTAAGDKLVLGFGPIDGLTVERRTADRTQGDRGLIARSDTDAETVEIEVENLTRRDWPLRIVDRVPVSEEEDLRVAWTADPQPTTTDPDGRRGILFWDQPLPAGEKRMIRLTTDLSWPTGRHLLR